MSNGFKSGAIVLLFLLISFSTFAQVVSPPKWDVKFSDKNLRIGEEASITFQAQIPRNWYIYSNDFEDVGPVQISLILEETTGIGLKGGLTALNPKTKYDEIWEGDVKYFEKEGLFRQLILVNQVNVKVSGTLEYQMCSEISGQCILFEEDFTLTGRAAEKKK